MQCCESGSLWHNPWHASYVHISHYRLPESMSSTKVRRRRDTDAGDFEDRICMFSKLQASSAGQSFDADRLMVIVISGYWYPQGSRVTASRWRVDCYTRSSGRMRRETDDGETTDESDRDLPVALFRDVCDVVLRNTECISTYIVDKLSIPTSNENEIDVRRGDL
jgi:hypothetical protein